MTRYKLTIEYKGTDYHGWQKQKDLPTIQEAIENAIYKFSGQYVKTIVAGRTDAGVHAHAQIAHVDLKNFSKPMKNFEIAKAINAHLLPQPISILDVEAVDNEFHARFSAKNKVYRYKILNRNGFIALEQNMAWHIRRKLDANKMHECAQVLLGEHDFSTFRDSECQAKSPVKTINRIDVEAFDYDSFGGQMIHFEVEGQSFLHHQVRNIIGSLTLVGKGKWEKHDLKSALEAKDRTKGGPTAPADGLYLVKVGYE